MIVIPNEKESCTFGDLDPGDVFICGYSYYMKLDADISEPNAVNLQTAEPDKFGANATIFPVNGKFIVE